MIATQNPSTQNPSTQNPSTQNPSTQNPSTQPDSTPQRGAVPQNEQMQAIVQTSYGNAEVLTMGTIGQPQIADNEVLVDVRAAGLDRGTWHLMTGQPYLIRLGFGLRRPRNPVPGLDLAGVVAAVGADVTRFEVG
ncbi:MAG: alcohol dehydrogenase catalytic domain-containing protein, partial [Acidimicrobiales bacterium]